MDSHSELWLVRHAEAEWSLARKHTGRTDIPLTDAGRDRARELAAVVGDAEFDLVLCSPLSRARETASLAGLGDRAVLSDGLLEWDYGDYDGVRTDEIRVDRPDWYLWTDGCPGGESPADVSARVDAVIEEVLAVDGSVALVAHGHVLRALAARWLELPVVEGGRLALSTGAVCVLGFEREVRVVWKWNDASGD